MSKFRRTAHPIICPPPVDGICEIMPHQQEALDSDANIKMPQWGRGAGKTIYTIEELKALAHKFPTDIGFIVAQTGPMLEQWRLGKLEPSLAWFEQCNGYRMERKFKRTPFPRYELITGGEWWLIPSDNPDKLRGPDFGYGVLEEAAICMNQEALWAAIMPTFRANPDFTLILPTTPRPESFLVQHCLEKFREGDRRYWTTKASSFVNTFTDPQFWKDLKKELHPDIYQQEVFAEMVKVEGAIYGKAFLDNVCNAELEGGNVLDFDPARTTKKAPDRYNLIAGVDWGTAANSFIVIVRDMVADIDIIVDELCLDNMSVEQATSIMVKRVHESRKRYGLEMHTIYTDPNGQKWNSSLRKKLNGVCRVIYTWDKKLTDRHTGIELVMRRMLDANFKRRLFISKKVCAMEHNGPGGRGIYQGIKGGYKWAKIIKTGHFRPDPAHSKYDHACDALRYAFINTYFPTIYKG